MQKITITSNDQQYKKFKEFRHYHQIDSASDAGRILVMAGLEYIGLDKENVDRFKDELKANS